MSTSKYADMTLSKLKEELRKRKGKLSGRKRDLITRYVLFTVRPTGDNGVTACLNDVLINKLRTSTSVQVSMVSSIR